MSIFSENLLNRTGRRLRRWWQQRLLRRTRIPLNLWEQVLQEIPLLQRLTGRERQQLRKLASLFLHDKQISGAGGQQVDEFMRVYIAAQACLMILKLHLENYTGWSEVIVYPDTFVVDREEIDSSGVVHTSREALGGEAWGQGPVILSWADACPAAQIQTSGSNVILHEFAHKLDMQNGVANGMPPLHKGMVRTRWTRAFSQAYDDLCQRLREHQYVPINSYAATDPGEFFAVTSEYFFAHPHPLKHLYPAVYAELRRYYRQDPLPDVP